jgi:NADPH:quinone reductase-like Zn-dependent oxidoreductase
MLQRTETREGAKHAVHIPHTILAAAIDRFGGPEVLNIHALPVPAVGPREVLIALDTAGVGPWDLKIREGLFSPRKLRFPLVLGVDGAGVVMAVGSRVRRFKIGDWVYSYNWANPKGCFDAEYVVVPADKVGLVPKRLDLEHAGAIAAIGLTALQGIVDHLRVQRGEFVIVHGGSGGVGTLAIQFAKLRRARVLASASGIDGLELVRDMGADLAVDSRHDDVAAAARRFAPNGIDAVLALAGGNALEDVLSAVGRGGRLAYPNGVEPVPAKRRGIKFISYDGISGTGEFERLNRAVTSAKLKVPISERFPLADAAKAHEHLAAGHVLGKTVLRIRHP